MGIDRTTPENFQTLFAGGVFAVPSYQRDYAWRIDNYTKFLEDLVELTVKIKRTGQPDTRYVGAVVIVGFDESLSDVDRATIASPDEDVYHIVDGQQRVATVMLLLSAMGETVAAETFPAEEPEKQNFLAAINQQLRVQIDDPKRLRLSLSRKDMDQFSRLIAEPHAATRGRLASHRRLFDARKYFLDNIPTYATKYVEGPAACFESRLDFMRSLRQTLLKSFVLTQITVDSVSTAFEVFESLNASGVELNEADLVKNQVLCVAAKGNVITARQASDRWDEISRRVGDDFLVTFLRHFLCAKRGSVVRKTDIYDEIKKELGQVGADSLLTDLHNQSGIYSEVSLSCRADDYYKLDATVRNSLAELKALGQVQPRIFLPYALTTFTVRESRNIADKVVSLAVRYRMTGRSPAGLEPFWAELAGRLNGIGEPIDYSGVLQRLQEQMPSDTVFQTEFATWREETQADRPFIRNVLLRIENRLDRENARSIDPENLTVEHIIPQDVEWDEWFDGHPPEPDDRDAIIFGIGNLAILYQSENSSASNRNYPAKRLVYQTPNEDEGLPPAHRGRTSVQTFRMIKKVVEEHPESFGVAEVKARAEELALQAVEIWK